MLLEVKFGRAKCFDSGCNDKNHKFFVKANAKLTQRISSKFATQLANNDYDRVVIERVFDFIRPLCSQNHSAERATVVESDEHVMDDCYYDRRRRRRRRNCMKRMLLHRTLNRIWSPVMY
jgi:hypothetical protein